jgi:hypothetical protein
MITTLEPKLELRSSDVLQLQTIYPWFCTTQRTFSAQKISTLFDEIAR